ncbi:sn-glycerol-3-phosphate ABC transporter ATP-binding protein UgpC [Desulfococcaceae bacterium HSG8]|nr:sn-glycerol-3-phosphate ABC transporter ATP-binding protein UgpC [Desulfococcaceae bacterium HSG8]
MASIQVTNVYKCFDDVQVINGVDLKVDEGELMVFVGPSGCGKTTLLRLIAGLEPLTSGDIYIGDRLMNDVPPKDRNIAMVFQNYALYPHMTVAQNIDFGLRLRGVSKQERETSVKNVAEMLGLSDMLDRRPRELSGGQRQRVAMGRCIVRNPDVFLMDEPLSNLDAKLRNHMRVEIRQLQRNLGKTMIYVTHDQVEAMTLADRIAVLENGYVSQIGKPDELYTRPANVFVAGFIGTPAMNFIEASRQSDRTLSLPDGVQMTLPQDRATLLNGEKYTVGIRPEHIILHANDRDEAGKILWPSRVTLCEPLGGESLLHVSMGEFMLRLKVSRNETVGEGTEVWPGFEVANAHIFDSGTGECISPALYK